MPGETWLEEIANSVFEDMKDAYLHEMTRVEAARKPPEHALFEEYREAVQSEDSQAIPNLIALRGQESFDRQARKGIAQTRQQMWERGVK